MRGPTVLVLEDDAHALRQIVPVLRAHGCRVLSVRTTARALAVLRRTAGIDVLLADLDVASTPAPSRLARHLHRRRPALGIVSLSRRVRRLAPDQVPGAGSFLPRPVPVDALLREVWDAAGRGPHAPGASCP